MEELNLAKLIAERYGYVLIKKDEPKRKKPNRFKGIRIQQVTG